MRARNENYTNPDHNHSFSDKGSKRAPKSKLQTEWMKEKTGTNNYELGKRQLAKR